MRSSREETSDCTAWAEARGRADNSIASDRPVAAGRYWQLHLRAQYRDGVRIMSIVRCPRCRDEVTVPAKASGRALVRCPLCLEEYLLAEALTNAPPPLVIIGGEVEQSAIQSSAPGTEYQ